MAFIDELIEKGGLPYGMEVEQPKAHDEINRLVIDDDIQNITQNLVMGTMSGAGVGKGIRQLVLALKGKIKGGKMIPSQPIRKGVVGKPSGQRHSSMISGKNPFWNKYGKGKLSEYKELADEYDYVGLAHPERADEIFSIFQKQFGNKNAAKVINKLLKIE